MTTEPIALPDSIHDRGLRSYAAAPAAVAEEARHDALQAVGTILALLEVGALTVDDPQLTSTRLAQIGGEVLCLRSLLRDAILGSPDVRAWTPVQEVVDVADETTRLVSAATVGWTGAVGVVADTSARATVSACHLRRILRNILRNAVRAAGPEGQVRVTVSPSAAGVQIEVEDDGPGFGVLPARHGIGLRSVRRLVQLAGGRVETGSRSRLGGASVRIHLPAVTTEAAS